MENKKELSISIVIPTYNEESSIERTLRFARDFMEVEYSNYEVIVSDDGSKDETKKIVSAFIKLAGKKFKLLENKHMGKGPAVRFGIMESKMDYVLFMDADGATPIKELKRLLIWVTEQGYDIAIASREGLGALRKGEPYFRHLLGRVFNTIVQFLALPGIQDTQCGYKLFKTDIAKRIFNNLQVYKKQDVIKDSFMGAFDVEVLLLAKIYGYRVKEVPVTWSFVESKRLNPLRDSFKMLRDVLKIRWNVIRGKYK